MDSGGIILRTISDFTDSGYLMLGLSRLVYGPTEATTILTVGAMDFASDGPLSARH